MNEETRNKFIDDLHRGLQEFIGKKSNSDMVDAIRYMVGQSLPAGVDPSIVDVKIDPTTHSLEVNLSCVSPDGYADRIIVDSNAPNPDPVTFLDDLKGI